MIRTRFAPSPTGYLHIGGVRTALFNWLLAKQSDGGAFILRIDDTDDQRNVTEALQPILDGFKWLGMDWDEGPEVGGPHGPYFQSQRGDLYSAAVKKLLDSGHAYRDYSTTEEFGAQRQAAEKAKENFLYDRAWMAEDDETAAKFEAEGRTGIVRLKMPREGQCVIEDLVRGTVTVDWTTENDHVIQRANGSCLYHLASVVDDHELKISHVIRSEEHLSNTPRQIFILESLGYERPAYGHLPFVAEPAGNRKLSKRKLKDYIKNKDFAKLLARGNEIAEKCGIETQADTFNPVIIDFYREIGFLPDAILNYLVLLGWALDGEREKFTVPEMIDLFTMDRVRSAPASFDPQKLTAFQSDAFVAVPLEQRIELVTPFAVAAGFINDDNDHKTLASIVQAAGDRLKMAGDIVDYGYFFSDEFTYDEKAFNKRMIKPENACDLLGQLSEHLSTQDDFAAAELEASVKGWCEQQDIGLGKVIHSLRVSTTGQAAGFGMFETLEVLGKEKTLKRIAAGIERATT